jgi:hypothetical protein
MAKERILAKVATLLEKFSERLVRVSRETRQNTDAVAALTDKVRLEVGAQQERLAALADEAAQREHRQTLRDQNNVQALVNLRDSTQKAFSQVRDDVEGLLKQIQRLNERLGQAESKIAFTGPSAIDQSIVDSKLAGARSFVDMKLKGVYDVTADLERRLREVEDIANPPVNYLGHKVRLRDNILIVNGNDFFPFQHEIVRLELETFGVIVGLKNGDQYILCGGPNPSTMYVGAFKLGPQAQSTAKAQGTIGVNESGQHLDRSDPRVNP